MTNIVKFLDMPLDRIDELCKEADLEGEKVIISINTYDMRDELTGGFSKQIKSSRDLFQFDGNNNNKDD